METIELKFNNELISFEKDERDVMVNATQMANLFGKRVDVFLKTDHANKFIEAILSTPFGGDKIIFTKENIIQGNKKGGTWMHRILALKFAAWLSPEFEVWVYSKIDEILYEYAKVQEESITNTVKLNKTIKEKKKLLEAENEDYRKILELEDELRDSKKQRSNSTKKKFKEVYDLFNLPEE